MVPALNHFVPLTKLVMRCRERANARSLRGRCEAILRELPIPAPFDEQSFCAALAAQRGRPITLWSLPLRAMTARSVIYGMAISTPDCDIIIYERDTSPLHQRQIIVHEACHLILGHRAMPLLEHKLLEQIQACEDPTVTSPAFGQTGLSEAEEQQAEILASLILERVAVSIRPAGHDHDVETTATLVRLASFYGLRGDE